jgi:hypothetical protein
VSSHNSMHSEPLGGVSTSTNIFPAPAETDLASIQHSDSTVADPVLEAVNDTVLHSPSLLGRVIDIASHWDQSTQTYGNPLVAGADGAWVDEALRRLHLETFMKWLGLSLKSQKRDLAVYLNLMDRNERPRRLHQLFRDAEYLVPTGAIPEERELFVQDLKIVHALLQDEI